MFQKSIRNTVFMLLALVIFSVIANYTLVGYGSVYYLVVNPLFWVAFMIVTTFFTAKTNESKLFYDKILEYGLIAAFINVRNLYCIRTFC